MDSISRWTNVSGTVAADSIDDVSHPIPEGWIVNADWHTVGTSDDPDGWEYSVGFFDVGWFNKPSADSKPYSSLSNNLMITFAVISKSSGCSTSKMVPSGIKTR
jgi:hypothetical protein